LRQSGAAFSGSIVPEIERVQYEAAKGEARELKRGLWQQQQAIPPRQNGKTYQAALAPAASNSVMASSEEKEPLGSLYWQI
jgi:hypothetical protein